MTKLKIIVSPFYSEESFEDKITGFRFHKTDSPYVITLDDERLEGIKEGLRKNFLIPYDKTTLDFITTYNLSDIIAERSKAVVVEEKPAEEKLVEEKKVNEVKEEVQVEKEKKNRSRKKKEVTE